MGLEAWVARIFSETDRSFRDCARELGGLLVELLLKSRRNDYRDRRQLGLLLIVHAEEVARKVGRVAEDATMARLQLDE